MIVTRRTAAPRAELDHLVVAAATLADGIDYIAALTGATPQPGGRHVAMGTHNALLHLGERAYLEIIATDPAGAKPPRPRWFDLDDVALQAELVEQPRLVHWVARTADIERSAAACPLALGAILPFERGDFRWRITVPEDGRRPARGVVPALIQWDVPFHPADRLPGSGVSIAQFGATHSDPGPARAALAALGLEDTLHVTYDRETRLAAMLRTPRGIVTL
ncbi:MAG TPA: VOC family protein [Casimicrobiaceae bacterium]|nr:VOC family protein [Casimicrobiaceae bacterium]